MESIKSLVVTVIFVALIIGTTSGQVAAQLLTYGRTAEHPVHRNSDHPVVASAINALRGMPEADQRAFTLYYGSSQKHDLERALVFLWQELSRHMYDSLDDVPKVYYAHLNNEKTQRYHAWAYRQLKDKSLAILAREIAKREKCSPEIEDLYDLLVARFDAVETYLTVIGAIDAKAAGKYYDSILKASVQIGFELAFQRISRSTSKEELIANIAIAGIEAAFEIGSLAQDNYSRTNAAHEKILNSLRRSNEESRKLITRLIADKNWTIGFIPLESLEKGHVRDLLEHQPSNPFFYAITLQTWYLKDYGKTVDKKTLIEVLQQTPGGQLFGPIRAELATALITSELDSEVKFLRIDGTSLLSYHKAPTPNSTELVLKCAGMIDGVSSEDVSSCQSLHVQLARALSLSGQFKKATSLREAIAREPNNFFLPKNFYYVHACAGSMAGEFDIAISALKESLKDNSSFLAESRRDADLDALRKNRKTEFLTLTTPTVVITINEGIFRDSVTVQNTSIFPLTAVFVTLSNGIRDVKVSFGDMNSRISRTVELSGTLEGKFSNWKFRFDCNELNVK